MSDLVRTAPEEGVLRKSTITEPVTAPPQATPGAMVE